MKKVLLVGGLSSDAEDYPSLQLLHTYMRGVFGEEVQFYATHLNHIQYTIGPGLFAAHDAQNNLDINSVQGVFIRGPKMRILSEHAYYLSRFCAYNHIVCFNDYSLYYPGTKAAQQVVFLEQQAPFLKTLYAIDKQQLVERAEQLFGFPFILKTNAGSHGDSNYLVQAAEGAQAVLAREPEVDFLAQAFCPNDRDYRLLLMGGEPLVFERRGSAGSHLNNTSKGAVAARADGALPAAIIDKARDVAGYLHLMISGVDIMPHKDTGEFYFLEVNSQPQLRTGALLEEKKAGLRQLFASKL